MKYLVTVLAGDPEPVVGPDRDYKFFDSLVQALEICVKYSSDGYCEANGIGTCVFEVDSAFTPDPEEPVTDAVHCSLAVVCGGLIYTVDPVAQELVEGLGGSISRS